jgi:hypothetical protein
MVYRPECGDPDRKRISRLNSSELNCCVDRGRIPCPIRVIVPIKDNKRVSLPVGRRNTAGCIRLDAQSPTEISTECHLDTLGMRAS